MAPSSSPPGNDDNLVVITDIITASVFKDAICEYLSSDDIVTLFQVSPMSQAFQLGHYYCRQHGTALDVPLHDHDQQDDKNAESSHNPNKDIDFLIYFLEQAAFFSQEEDVDNPSTNPVRQLFAPFPFPFLLLFFANFNIFSQLILYFTCYYTFRIVIIVSLLVSTT